MKKIGIIGSGDVAKTLASGLVRHGYKVMLSSRDKIKRENLAKETGLQAGTFKEAVAFGDLVVLSVQGGVAESVVKLLSDDLKGKTVMDLTNPISDKPPVNGVLHFFTSLDDSLMERLQKHAPAANFVKGLNCVGSAFMVDPSFESKPTMFICGNSTNAKKDVKSLLEGVGWEVEDMGNAESARAIEPLCMLWCIPGLREGKWSHALKLLKK